MLNETLEYSGIGFKFPQFHYLIVIQKIPYVYLISIASLSNSPTKEQIGEKDKKERNRWWWNKSSTGLTYISSVMEQIRQKTISIVLEQKTNTRLAHMGCDDG